MSRLPNQSQGSYQLHISLKNTQRICDNILIVRVVHYILAIYYTDLRLSLYLSCY